MGLSVSLRHALHNGRAAPADDVLDTAMNLFSKRPFGVAPQLYQ